MAKYIYQTKTCLKSEIYGNIKTILLAAGWQNISSSYESDGDVFYSTGESENVALYLNIHSSNTSGANDTQTTDYNVMAYRFPDTYVPGDVGSAGTFGRTVAQEAWKNMYIAPTPTTISNSVTVTLRYHCNKNRLMFAVIYPDASGVAPVFNYIGMADEVYVTTEGSRDMIFATTAYNVSNSNVTICNAVASMPSDTSSSSRNTYVQLPPKQVNSDGKVIMSEIFYGSNSEGMRGKITGVFGISASSPVLNSGNIITIGTEQYMVILCGTASYNAFQTLYLAFQIA